jgi:hypothetical protein
MALASELSFHHDLCQWVMFQILHGLHYLKIGVKIRNHFNAETGTKAASNYHLAELSCSLIAD